MNNFKPSRGLSRYMFGRITGRRNPNDIDYGFLLTAGLALLVVITLWWTPLLFPFRIFTTTVHEASHAVVGMVTGGKLKPDGAIELRWNGSGVTYFYNVGFDILTYAAGYVGSTLFGGFLLLMAKRASTRRQVLYYITAALVLLTVFFIRDVQSIIMVGLVAVLTGLVAYKAPDLVVTFYVFVTAILNVAYALFDLLGLVFTSVSPFEIFDLNGKGGNDASFLAARTGIPAIVWALIWSALSIYMLWRFVRIAIRVGYGQERAPRKSLFGGFGGGKRDNSANGKAQSAFDRYDKLFK